MKFTNSPLVNYTRLSPNHSGQRNHAIDTISIHCVVGQCSVETLGEIFAPTSRQASANYAVGVDGRIGMYVEEKNRSWCTSSSANDNRAVTIEVASDTTEPYAVRSVVYDALIKLVADICKRNGIAKLVWSTDKNQRVNHLNGCNMTVHRDYDYKSCPGTFLYDRHGDIAAKVNAILGAKEDPPKTSTFEVGDVVDFIGTKEYISSGGATAYKCKPGKATVTQTYDGKHPYHLIAMRDGTSDVYGWVDAADVRAASDDAQKPYLVKVTADILNIRTGPGTDYAVVGSIRDHGTYTIVDTHGDWGKLKSGAGWIYLDYTQRV